MKQVIKLFSIIIILVSIGTIGFMSIEHWSFLDSLYMSVITLSTVGYETVGPFSPGGKLFAVVFILLGLSVFLYSAVQIGEMAVSGELNHFFMRRKMNKGINALKNHYIICGAGRMGMKVCERLKDLGHSFVLVDINENLIQEKRKSGWPGVVGDATQDSVLKLAGIERAACLATLFRNDAINVFVTLSARLLVHGLKVIARSSDEDSALKLRKAGATKTISPIAAGALKVTQMLSNPNMEEFIEIFSEKEDDIDLTVVKVEKNAPYVGKALSETNFRQLGVMIIGIRRKSGELLLPPPSNEKIHAMDSLIAVGKSKSLLDMVGQTHT